MPRAKSSLFLAFLVLGLAAAATNPDVELQLLHVVFRHGDKVPHREFQNYPNDPYRDHSYYPMGNGDLTNEGKMREYKIGMMLRERYDRFIGPDYWPAKIYARSTEVPRTQLSLQLVMAGLFPPSTRQTWNPHLPWIPTWSFFIPYETDYLLFPHYCHRYKEEYKRFLQFKDTKEMVDRYKNVMDYLTDHTGKLIDDTLAVSHLYNLFKEQASQNLTLPPWTESVYPEPMEEITKLNFKLKSYTTILKKLNGGKLIRKLVDDVREHQAGKTPPDRKAFLFGCHESNIAAVTLALETNEPALPAFGATVIMETLRDKAGQYYIRMLLWTGTTEQLMIQTIPGCAELCPFETFLDIVRNVLPDDDEYYCRRDKTTEGMKANSHRSAATSCATDDGTWRCIFLIALLAFACKFIEK